MMVDMSAAGANWRLWRVSRQRPRKLGTGQAFGPMFPPRAASLSGPIRMAARPGRVSMVVDAATVSGPILSTAVPVIVGAEMVEVAVIVSGPSATAAVPVGVIPAVAHLPPR